MSPFTCQYFASIFFFFSFCSAPSTVSEGVKVVGEWGAVRNVACM
jgi:hypothetical protein